MKNIITLVAVFVTVNISAQNLITNGDFENYTLPCPTSSPNGAFLQVAFWHPPNAMPTHGVPHAELYCNNTPNYGLCLPGPVPNTGSNGPAYVGFHTRNINPVYNEAIYQVLTNPLTSGSTYLVSFDLMTCQSGLFTSGKSDFCLFANADTIIPGCPFTNPAVIEVGCVPFDSISETQWKHHSFSFTAPPNCNIVGFSGDSCFSTDIYYYLDNVVLTLLNSLEYPQSNSKESILQNPFSESTVYSFNYMQGNKYSFKITDCNGKLVRNFDEINKSNITIERGNLYAGMYFYILMSNGKITDRGKLLIQ